MHLLKCLGLVLNPVPLSKIRDAIKPLVQCTARHSVSVSYTYHDYILLNVIISLCLNITSSCRKTEFETILFSYFYDAKPSVK